MEERDVTQTAALENAGDAALKVSGRCAGFKLSLRAPEQTAQSTSCPFKDTHLVCRR